MTATTATTVATTNTTATTAITATTATTAITAITAKEDQADLVENHVPELAWSEIRGLHGALVYDRRDAVSRQKAEQHTHTYAHQTA